MYIDLLYCFNFTNHPEHNFNQAALQMDTGKMTKFAVIVGLHGHSSLWLLNEVLYGAQLGRILWPKDIECCFSAHSMSTRSQSLEEL